MMLQVEYKFRYHADNPMYDGTKWHWRAYTSFAIMVRDMDRFAGVPARLRLSFVCED